MQKKYEAKYEGAPAQVREVLLSAALADKRAAALGAPAGSYSFERRVSGEHGEHDKHGEHGELINTVLRTEVPASALPAQVQKLLSKKLRIVVESSSRHAGGNDAAGTSTFVIELAVRIEGAPVTAAGTVMLKPESGSGNPPARTTAEIAANFSVRVPFIGASIEAKAANMLPDLLARDAELVNSLLH